MASVATEAPTRVLVTGATGFVAAHVIQQLQRAGFRVRGTVRDPASYKARSLTDTFPGLELARADLTDDGGWDEATRDCSFVVHMASPFPGRIPRVRRARAALSSRSCTVPARANLTTRRPAARRRTRTILFALRWTARGACCARRTAQGACAGWC